MRAKISAVVFVLAVLSGLTHAHAASQSYSYIYKDTQIVMRASTRLVAVQDRAPEFARFRSEHGVERDRLSDHHALAGAGLGIYRLPDTTLDAGARRAFAGRLAADCVRAGMIHQPVFELGPAILIPSDEVVVGFKADAALDEAAAYLMREAAGLGIIGVRPTRRNAFVVRIENPGAGRCFSVARALAGLAAIAFAEPNQRVIMRSEPHDPQGVPEFVGRRRVSKSIGAAPAASAPLESNPAWTVLASVDCENLKLPFPPAGWDAYAASGYTTSYWGRTSYRSFAGTYSAYCARSGAEGVVPPGPAPIRMQADLDSPLFDLSAYKEVYIEVWFYAKNDLPIREGRLYDYGEMFVVNNTSGEATGAELGTSATGDCTTDPTATNGWRKCLFRVPPEHRVKDAYFKFRYVSDASRQFEGCYIDNIRIVATTNIDTNPLGIDAYGARQWPHQNVGQVAGLCGFMSDMDTPPVWTLLSVSTGITVAVIDSGFDTNHPDLNCVGGYDYDGGIGGYARGNHGTACAGLVGARRNNTIGVIGTAPGVRLISVFYGTAWPEHPANAIDTAVDNGAHVLSCSWGINGGASRNVEDAIDDAIAAGRVVVCAAGNGPDRDPWNYNVHFPGNLTGSKDVICVGASSPTDEPKGVASSDGKCTWGSSYVGDGPDLVAPGVWTYTTDRLGANGYNPGGNIETNDNGDYDHDFGGTSASTPQVAGIIALMLSYNPALTPGEVKTILRATADYIGSSERAGRGRVNAYRAVAASIEPPPVPASVSASKGSLTNGIRVAWHRADRAVSYEVRRSTHNDFATAAHVSFVASGTSFEDTAAAAGRVHYYWVNARNAGGASAFSASDYGFRALAPPAVVMASGGIFTDRIRVTWHAVEGASEYDVWRGTNDDFAAAARVATTSSAVTSYDDTAASVGLSYYYWVKARAGGIIGAVGASVSGWRRSAAFSHYADMDLDGDGKADLVIFDPVTGVWRARLSGSGYAEVAGGIFGDATRTLVPADYDGDGQTDPAVYFELDGTWTIMLSSLGYRRVAVVLGGLGHAPVPGDYDGDRKADLAVYCAADGRWTMMLSGSGYARANAVFGDAGWLPVQRDYDGDRKTDLAVYNLTDGGWAARLSASGYSSVFMPGFGGIGHAPVPGDYDGDGKAAPAIYNATTGLWTVLLSGSDYAVAQGTLGGAGYAPMPGDYDGDGKTDLAVYNAASGGWLVMLSGSGHGLAATTFGGTGFEPVGEQPAPASR